ncbi:sensor histidine kinase [Arsukibacterium perlucidum]|uniref:sensor histidine kinase n=1 Tax=Arsukibacterium perlucidum TaxID=368811 RepID=UPI00036F625C|nr:histidine kinase [Arsukibacterium perlucidum]
MNKPLSYWRQHWQLCWQTNRAYRIGQALTFVLFVSFYLLYSLPFMMDEQQGLLVVFFIRYLLEATCFVLVSHFLLRPPLRIFYYRGFNLGTSVKFAGLLMLASLILALVSVFISFLPALSNTDMQQIAIVDKDSAEGLQMHFSLTTLVIMMWSMHFGLYILWSLFYLGWQMRQSRIALQEEMQQARLQQLTNQLNPHFLFNALNSIRALIFEDQHKAADTLTQLAELFRVHLQAHLRPTASLQEEWLLCQHYLKIEQVRLEHRLQLEVNITDDVLQQLLPTLCLLTLLENAVKHGISPNAAAGSIAISASRLGNNRWQLLVTNTFGAVSDSQCTGTGLSNCRKRLQLMFGEQASISTEHNKTHYIVRLELPYA